MKQSISGKSNVAWFKLAEFVSRGEKERALALYRLLAHSLGDKPFVEQLRGDLLVYFSAQEAREWYEKAAQLYEMQQRYPQAVSVYESLVIAYPDSRYYVRKLFDVNAAHGDEQSMISSFLRTCRGLATQHEAATIKIIIDHVKSQGLDKRYAAHGAHQFARDVVTACDITPDDKHKLLDWCYELMDVSESLELNGFLAWLDTEDNGLYQWSLKHLKRV